MIKLTVKNSWTEIECPQSEKNQLYSVMKLTYNYFINGIVCPECDKVIPSAKWMYTPTKEGKKRIAITCWGCKQPIINFENYKKTVSMSEKIDLFKEDRYIPTGYLIHLIPKIRSLNLEYQIIDHRERILNNTYDNQIEELRYYQRDACDIAIKKSRGIIKAATGSGKTQIAAWLAFNTAPPVLIIVPDLTLLEQTYQKFLKWTKSLSIGKIGDGVFCPGDITIATAATLNSRFETEEVKELLKSINSIYLDEGHHCNLNKDKIENTWYNIIMATDAYYRYAFSATIGLEGSIERAILECTTGSLIYEIKADELVKAGYLSQPIVEIYEIPHVYNDERGWSRLESLFICNSLYRNTTIAHLAEKYSQQGTVLVSVNKIIHGENLQKLIPSSIFIQGKSENRVEVIEKFKNKEIKILITTLLREGADIPSLQTIINAGGGTGYRNDDNNKDIGISVIQKAGRALRKVEGKTHGTIVDFIDKAVPMLRKHSKERIKTYENEGFTVNLHKELVL